jgi:sugar lactone lactonase YvrE
MATRPRASHGDTLILDDSERRFWRAAFRGRRLNRPNDVVVKSDAAIYFTDPRPQRTAGFRALGISPRSLEEELEAMLKHGKTQTQKTLIPDRD